MLERNRDPLAFKVGRTDLVWRVRYDLLAFEDTGLDELAYLMMTDAELCGRVAQRQPLTVLLSRAVA